MEHKHTQESTAERSESSGDKNGIIEDAAQDTGREGREVLLVEGVDDVQKIEDLEEVYRKVQREAPGERDRAADGDRSRRSGGTGSKSSLFDKGGSKSTLDRYGEVEGSSARVRPGGLLWVRRPKDEDSTSVSVNWNKLKSAFRKEDSQSVQPNENSS